MIDYDAESEAAGDKSLWTEREFGDFVLRADWRIKSTPYVNPSVPNHPLRRHAQEGRDGKEIRIARAGFRLGDLPARLRARRRSTSGAGRSDPARSTAIAWTTKMPPAVRAGVTPKRNADRDIGEWNTFEITMRGNRLTVVLNGQEVLSQARAARAARRAGRSPCSTTASKKDGAWASRRAWCSSANISIKSCTRSSDAVASHHRSATVSYCPA